MVQYTASMTLKEAVRATGNRSGCRMALRVQGAGKEEAVFVCVHTGVPLTRVAGLLQAGSVRSCCVHCTAATEGVQPYMRRAGSVDATRELAGCGMYMAYLDEAGQEWEDVLVAQPTEQLSLMDDGILRGMDL